MPPTTIEAGNDQQVYVTLIDFYEYNTEGEFFLFSISDRHFLMLIDHDNNVKFMCIADANLTNEFINNIPVKLNDKDIPIANIPNLGFISASTILVSLIAQKYEKQADQDIALDYNFISETPEVEVSPVTQKDEVKYVNGWAI